MSSAFEATNSRSSFKSYGWPPARQPNKCQPGRKKRRLRWGRIISVGLGLGLIGASSIYALVNYWPESRGSFDELLPANSVLAVVGEKAAVGDFLQNTVHRQDLASLGINSQTSKQPDAQQNKPIAYAVLPGGGAELSPRCRANIGQIAASIEDSWNEDYRYPASLPPLPPCPSHGQLTYQSDGQAFTLCCRGKDHQTAYNSNEGLEQQQQASPAFVACEPEQKITQANMSLTPVQNSKLVIASAKPKLVAAALQKTQQEQSFLSFDGPNDASLKVVCTSEEFSRLYPQLTARFPQGSRVSLWRSADGQHYSLRAKLTPQPILNEQLDAAKHLAKLPPSPSQIVASRQILELLGVWPNYFDNNKAAYPSYIGAACDVPLHQEHIFGDLTKCMALRSSVAIVAGFSEAGTLEQWVTKTPWGDLSKCTNTNLCRISPDEQLVSLHAGSISSSSAYLQEIPEGPSAPQAAGWFNLCRTGGQPTTLVFAAGLTEQELWLELNCVPAAAAQS